MQFQELFSHFEFSLQIWRLLASTNGSNNRFRKYESEVSRFFFDQLEQIIVKKVLFAKSNLTEMKYCENSGFVVLELVVGSCNQELFLRKYKKLNKT